MAMAFAPLSVLLDGIIIEDAQVVSKSFPTFWDEWKKLGFDIIELPA
jgi:3-phosphoshikimate 1-carboxyvinyltransferase